MDRSHSISPPTATFSFAAQSRRVTSSSICESRPQQRSGATRVLPSELNSRIQRRRELAEREGFEPPIGLHLCRISSAVRSTTLPPLRSSEGRGFPLRLRGPFYARICRRTRHRKRFTASQ